MISNVFRINILTILFLLFYGCHKKSIKPIVRYYMYDYYDNNWLLTRNALIIKEEVLNDSISRLQITNHNRHIINEYGISVFYDKKMFQKTNPFGDIWTMYNTINPMLISKIREEIPTIITVNGIKSAMLKMSNTQFKDFIRLKMPAITNSQMASVVASKNRGEFSTIISEIASPEKLGPKDFEKIFGKLDDLEIFNLTQNTINFKTVTEAVKKTAENANKFSNIAGKISNFVNLLVLTETLRTGESVSPADVLSVLPHPIALLSYWAEDVINNQEVAMNEAIWDVAPNWAFVVSWEEKWQGQPGIPDETLYMYYTDVQDKCNPEKIPTSIVIKDKQVAQLIFGFVPKYVDFDVQSRIFTKSDGKIFFKPTKQVAY